MTTLGTICVVLFFLLCLTGLIVTIVLDEPELFLFSILISIVVTGCFGYVGELLINVFN